MINHYSIIYCMGHSHDLHTDKLYEYRIPIITDYCIVEQSGFQASINHIHHFFFFHHCNTVPVSHYLQCIVFCLTPWSHTAHFLFVAKICRQDATVYFRNPVHNLFTSTVVTYPAPWLPACSEAGTEPEGLRDLMKVLHFWPVRFGCSQLAAFLPQRDEIDLGCTHRAARNTCTVDGHQQCCRVSRFHLLELFGARMNGSSVARIWRSQYDTVRRITSDFSLHIVTLWTCELEPASS